MEKVSYGLSVLLSGVCSLYITALLFAGHLVSFQEGLKLAPFLLSHHTLCVVWWFFWLLIFGGVWFFYVLPVHHRMVYLMLWVSLMGVFYGGLFLCEAFYHLPYSWNVLSVWVLWSHRNHVIDRVMLCCLIFIACGVFSVVFRHRSRWHQVSWAHAYDLWKIGLLQSKGFILGKTAWPFSSFYLRAQGHEHIAVFAPSGSGKSTAIAIPNLLSLDDSMVVTDVKGELFKMTSGHRIEKGHAVYQFNPFDVEGRTHAYNPLAFLSEEPDLQVDQLQVIANAFIAERANDAFWCEKSRELFIGVALYLNSMHPHEPLTFGAILHFLTATKELDAWLSSELEHASALLHPVAFQSLNTYLAQEEKTRANVLTSLIGYLSLWYNPKVENATAKSDFSFSGLRRKKMTVYLTVPANELQRLAPLLSLMYQQLLHALTAREPGEDEPYSVVLLLDEFATLDLRPLVRNIGLLRSFHIRVCLILQSIAQLYERYGRDAAHILMDTKYRVFFAQNNPESARYVSEMLGHRLREVRQQTNRGVWGNADSVQWQKTQQPLVQPYEVQQLNKEMAIVFIEGERPILARKSVYYRDKAWCQCIKPPVDVPFVSSAVRVRHSECPLSVLMKEGEEDV